MNSRFRRKTQRQKLLLVSWRHVGVHSDGHQHDVAIQSSINFGKSFLPISCIWKLHWPEFWRGSLHIYLLLFPRYRTLISKRFWSFGFFLIFSDSENQQLVFLKLSFFRMLFSNSFCRCCYEHDMCYVKLEQKEACLLYTSDAADEEDSVDLGGPTGVESWRTIGAVSYTHLRAHETDSYLVCRLLLEKKKKLKNS